MDEDEIISALEQRLKRATELLREWRDKHGGKEHHKFNAPGSYSPTDLARETQKFLEGR
jgi:hypothetical protein